MSAVDCLEMHFWRLPALTAARSRLRDDHRIHVLRLSLGGILCFVIMRTVVRFYCEKPFLGMPFYPSSSCLESRQYVYHFANLVHFTSDKGKLLSDQSTSSHRGFPVFSLNGRSSFEFFLGSYSRFFVSHSSWEGLRDLFRHHRQSHRTARSDIENCFEWNGLSQSGFCGAGCSFCSPTCAHWVSGFTFRKGFTMPPPPPLYFSPAELFLTSVCGFFDFV